MRYNGRDKYWAQHEINMPGGGGSVDRAPDSQRTNASSKLEKRTNLMRQCGYCLNKEGGSVVKAQWNALGGRHKYGATNGNQNAARRCSMITRLTRNSRTWVWVRWGAAIFAHYIWRSRLLSRSEENKNIVTNLLRHCGYSYCLTKAIGSFFIVLIKLISKFWSLRILHNKFSKIWGDGVSPQVPRTSRLRLQYRLNGAQIKFNKENLIRLNCVPLCLMTPKWAFSFGVTTWLKKALHVLVDWVDILDIGSAIMIERRSLAFLSPLI